MPQLNFSKLMVLCLKFRAKCTNDSIFGKNANTKCLLGQNISKNIDDYDKISFINKNQP